MTIENLMDAKLDELVAIRDIGEIVAKSIVDFMEDVETRNTILELLELGLKPEQVADKKSSKFAGQKFVLTGTLDGMSRRDAGEIIKQNGGEVVSSVSKNTDFVLAGDNAGSKLTKAQDLGVTVISLDEFKEML